MELRGYEFLLIIGAISVLLNLIFSAVVATIAEKRNQSWGIFFVVGILLGFTITLLFVLLHDVIHRHWKAEDRAALYTDQEQSAQNTTY